MRKNNLKISIKWYIFIFVLVITSNIATYFFSLDLELELILISSTVGILALGYFLRDYVKFSEEENSDFYETQSIRKHKKFLDEINSPSILINKKGIIQFVNAKVINNSKLYHNLEVGRNFFNLIDLKEIDLVKKSIKSSTNEIIKASLTLGFNSCFAVMTISNIEHSQHILSVKILNIGDNKNSESDINHSQKLQAIGQLAGGVAHDFNNLLTAIRGYSDLISVNIDPSDKIYNDVQQIRKNTLRAVSLVKQLLTFSKKQEISNTVINIKNIVSDTSSLLGRLLGEKIQLVIKAENQKYLVKADKGQIEQVITNLAVNARDAMKKGGMLTIEICEEQVGYTHYSKRLFKPIGSDDLKKGEYVVLKIRDNGKGIPKTILNRIFEPFFTTKGKRNGTGLGLSTVYGIVKQTGGGLFVKTSNKGTSFYIFLKKHKLLDEESFENSLGNSKKFITKKTKKNEVVLIAEDEEPVRTFSAQALRMKGYEVIETESAEEAEKILEDDTRKVDILISDVIMPGKDGSELAKKIIEKNSNIVIILMSGYSGDTILPKNLTENKNVYFISKPFSLADLIETTSKALKKLKTN